MGFNLFFNTFNLIIDIYGYYYMIIIIYILNLIINFLFILEYLTLILDILFIENGFNLNGILSKMYENVNLIQFYDESKLIKS